MGAALLKRRASRCFLFRALLTSQSYALLFRLDGCQPFEINKSLIRGSSSPIFQKHPCRLMHEDASPRHVLQVVAHAVAGIVPETKKTQGPGEPLSRVARKQLKWEKMMKDIEVSGSAVEILSSLKKDGKISRSDVLGTVLRLRQLNKWPMVLEVRLYIKLSVTCMLLPGSEEICTNLSRTLPARITSLKKYSSDIELTSFSAMCTQVLIWLKEQDWWNFGVQDFNLIIAAYGKLGQPENAESSFTEMREAGLEPNVACFTSLLEAHARAGNFERAESIYTEMVERGPAPTEVTYQVYINALCKVYHPYSKTMTSFLEAQLQLVNISSDCTVQVTNTQLHFTWSVCTKQQLLVIITNDLLPLDLHSSKMLGQSRRNGSMMRRGYSKVWARRMRPNQMLACIIL